LFAPDCIEYRNCLPINKIRREADGRDIFSIGLSKSFASIRRIIVSNLYVRRKKVRTLIYTLILLTAAASFSSAQNGGDNARLIARAELNTHSAPYGIRDRGTFTNDSPKLTPVMTGEDSADISLAVKKELKAERYSGIFYNSPSLKAEDLPLVMSSPDRKTISIVLPPFLYFKTQF
jgi:hypothetical protein